MKSLVEPLALTLGLSLFFGLAFEEFYAQDLPVRPGGVRTFPLLALLGTALFDIEPAHGTAFCIGLLIVGAWTFAYYRTVRRAGSISQPAEGEFVVPVCCMLAYALGPMTFVQAPWLSVAVVVATVLLLTGREALHRLAAAIPRHEIYTAGQFLLLTGVVLPLLPDVAVTPLTSTTPRQAWLALVAVSSLSYASYLVRKYGSLGHAALFAAALGGLYSSTTTTVVLARQSRSQSVMASDIRAGIVLATSIMYLRLELVIAIFNIDLASALAVPLLALFALGTILSALAYRSGPRQVRQAAVAATPRNPLQLGTAFVFAVLFVAVSLASNYVQGHLGKLGIYGLAALVGVTDIDPFVLSLAQGNVHGVARSTLEVAVLLAASSNNVLKAGYTIGFAGIRRSVVVPVAALSLLTLAGMALAMAL